jgi:glycogen debranching enzyme
MDVRIGDVLPTPRHGKPVEINAYWYNALMTMAHFERLLEGEERAKGYENLAGRVKESFLNKFWNEEKGCLYDVVSGNPYDAQVRPNQIWAVSLPFGMLDPQREKQVVRKVFEELYTPYGLRSLSPKDPEFKPFYGGSLWDRDTAYHQGTVWAFPLGAYYLAYLKVYGFTAKAAAAVMADLSMLEGTLREGCVGQIAEIFDGLAPTVSKGCFAQAWSVGELLRALKAAEQILRKQTAEALTEKEV